MTKGFGRDPALVASPSSPETVSTKGFDPAQGFTPGPWEREGFGITALEWDGEPPRTIAMTFPNIRVSSDESIRMMRANAHLIAAAPSLYEALKEVRDACLYADDDCPPHGIGITTEPHISEKLFDDICAALNKARGEQVSHD